MLEKKLMKVKKTHSDKTNKDYYHMYISVENDFDIRLEKVSCTEEQANKLIDLIKQNKLNDLSSVYEGRANKDGKYYAVCTL